MPYSNLLLDFSEGIATITINRSDKLNALNLATFAELKDALHSLSNKKDIHGVLMTGAGQKAFVAGADISEIEPLGESDGADFSRTGQKVFAAIEQFSVPVIALINGFALGGGCELAMACHLRICTPQSRFGQPEVNLGLIPGYGGTQRLPRLIGRAAALHLLLTGELISAERALQLGLVNQIVPAEDLTETGKSILRTISAKSPLAVAKILKLVNDGLDLALDKAIEQEAKYFGKQCASEDKAEGTRAFLEKRKPVFKGR